MVFMFILIKNNHLVHILPVRFLTLVFPGELIQGCLEEVLGPPGGGVSPSARPIGSTVSGTRYTNPHHGDNYSKGKLWNKIFS